MKIKIRKATLKDLDLIVNLWLEFRKDHSKILINNDKNMNVHMKLKTNSKLLFKKYIKEQILGKDSRVLIAFVDDTSAGYNLNFIKSNIPIFTLEKTGHIGDLFVKKEFRGLKISSKFKNLAFIWFKSKKVKYASLQVWHQNEYAHNIYRNWGFIDMHVEMRKKI